MKIRRGEQANVPLGVALVGGGRACYDLLRLLDKERLSRLKMKILGVSDVNQDAPGLRYARELQLFATTNMDDLFALEGLNLIIELTGSPSLRDQIYLKRPSGVSVIDHKATRLLWDLIQIEMEKTELEKERRQYLKNLREKTQVILDSLPYRIMVVNLDMTVETVNRTFLKEHGVTYDEVVGKTCYEVRYGLDKPCHEYGRLCSITQRLEEIKEKGLISTYQEYKDAKNETRFDVVTVAPIYDEKGEVVQILEASRDVTERIRLERELQEVEHVPRKSDPEHGRRHCVFGHQRQGTHFQ